MNTARGVPGVAPPLSDVSPPQSGRCADLQFDDLRRLTRMTKDSRRRRRDRLASNGDVGILLVLVAEFPALYAPVERRAIHTRREMAPVGAGHRTLAGVWARSRHVRTERNQSISISTDRRIAFRGARFDDNESTAGRLPRSLDHVACPVDGQFAKRIGRDDEIRRRNRQIGEAGLNPGDRRQTSRLDSRHQFASKLDKPTVTLDARRRLECRKARCGRPHGRSGARAKIRHRRHRNVWSNFAKGIERRTDCAERRRSTGNPIGQTPLARRDVPLSRVSLGRTVALREFCARLLQHRSGSSLCELFQRTPNRIGQMMRHRRLRSLRSDRPAARPASPQVSADRRDDRGSGLSRFAAFCGTRRLPRSPEHRASSKVVPAIRTRLT